MEHYNRCSALSKSQKVQKVIAENLLNTQESQQTQDQILQFFQGNN